MKLDEFKLYKEVMDEDFFNLETKIMDEFPPYANQETVDKCLKYLETKIEEIKYFISEVRDGN